MKVRESLPPAPVAPAGQHVAPEILAAHTAWVKGSKEIAGLMLMTMEPEIQRNSMEAIGNFDLSLPSGLVIVLNNCHYAPSITRGVISVSRLYEDGFINRFVNNTIQVSRNNMVYFSAIPRDGIFEIDLSNSYANKSSIYTVSNKRAKIDLDSALLWHCRLGHISKKRIEKLQHDGLLNSTDLRAFEKCVPCMSGKMARKPYTHQVERAKDLLGLIHTNVCGPFKITSRQGASYFVTFTDDFSRYGYVYLLKHKHEVFETFKVFQKEVENQLGKTIKSLCSDRGGEYMRVPTKRLKRHHTRSGHGPKPLSCLNLKVWGCEELVKRDTLTKPEKLEPRSIKCIFIGYPKETIGYSFYYPPENKVLVARNAKFLENSLIDQEASGSLEDLEIIQEEDTHPSIDTSLNHEEDDLEMDEPQGDLHWTTVKNILKYLRNTKDMFLVYGGDLKRELRVSCYTDAGYLTDADDLKSQTGYVFVLNGGAVDWKSAKQSIFATSSAEAEYIAAFDASKEAVWVRKFISGLGVVPTIEKPINMYCDNTGAIAIANESGITKGARHFRAKVHYLREVIEFGDIKLEKVHTDDNLADLFTKALAFPKHS
ncbi:retrotransposon protein, putative, ty1-copia subclass [Tanacetum coccineum]